MDVFISVDMEGIAGIAHPDQVMPGAPLYDEGRRLMTKEASAAVAGAFDGGATRVVVSDAHAYMDNIDPEALDPRAELVIGSPKVPLSMVQGIADGMGVALFVGYHGGAGTASSVLDHTYSGLNLYEVRLNGTAVTEAELNAAVIATYGVPVGLVTGDQSICEATEERLPKGVRTVQVKVAHGRQVAQSLSPTVARERVAEGAAEAVNAARAGELRLFEVEAPVELEVDTRNSLVAELMSLMPQCDRVGPRTVRHVSDDIRGGFRCLLAMTYVAASVPR